MVLNLGLIGANFLDAPDTFQIIQLILQAMTAKLHWGPQLPLVALDPPQLVLQQTLEQEQ